MCSTLIPCRNEDEKEPHAYLFWCPACDQAHAYYVKPWTACCGIDKDRKLLYRDGPVWEMTGTLDRATFRPSLLFPDKGCHIYVTDGQIQYLPDCTHAYAGKTIPIPDWDAPH